MRPVLFLALLALAVPATAQTLVSAFPGLPAFSNPVDLQAPDDGSNRLFLVEQAGRIRVFENDAAVTSASVFLDIDPLVTSGSETGLLGLAFDPDYAQNGYFYVNYTAASPLRTVIARYTVSASDPDVANPASAVILLTVNQPFSNHNAGQLAFGPPEGPGGERYLYVGFGDGGSSGDPFGNGQNRMTLLGSMLRLDVDGGGLPLDCAAGTGAATIPADNPFVGMLSACNEIYAYGLRNPWRYSFDPLGRLWIADVGQNAREEVDVVEAGDNLGWNQYEGTLCFNGPCDPAGKEFPIHEYPHTFNTSGGFAIIGGYVYDGPNCAALRDLYVYGDDVTGNVWTLDYDGTTATNALLIGLSGRAISSFGLDEQGDLYLTDLNLDRVYRFSCAQAVTVSVSAVGGPLVVGPGGGPVAFDLTLTNTTNAPQTIDVWADADLATGAEVAAVLGPAALTLAAGASVTRRVRVSVPRVAPAGTSTLVVQGGSYPGGSASSDRLTVTKLAAEGAAEGAAARTAAAGGAAIDAWQATMDAATADPAAPGVSAAATGSPVQLSVQPNPTGGPAAIRFELAAPADVRVEVLDVLGRQVALLADGAFERGPHAVTWAGSEAPAGLYVVRVTVGAAVQTRLLTRIR